MKSYITQSRLSSLVRALGRNGLPAEDKAEILLKVIRNEIEDALAKDKVKEREDGR